MRRARSWRATLTPFSHPTPSQAAKPPKPIPSRCRPKLKPTAHFQKLLPFQNVRGVLDGVAGGSLPPGLRGRVSEKGCLEPKKHSAVFVPGHAAVNGPGPPGLGPLPFPPPPRANSQPARLGYFLY